ncbi:tyrosine-type recombinase/integrase [Desulforamulus aeronauticus]|uniref:Phage integrase family protein n=1 Tax=Desulforamulus aeronauticus DSM 10349 TaxID=1121421 RepID=A0A1M6SBJ6_9FIRM|nr:tyrosine-type recombinase/integrase [Desulforamulus aeronauticus]SHK42075.1 Phage integrase family protein [Desulforamulus aeronauticus DSM 10349]
MLVQPIRDRAIVKRYKDEALKSGLRNYILITFQLNMGFRIGDVVGLKVKDVKGSHMILQEQKTGKSKTQFIPNELRVELDRYTQGMSDEDYLFPSRQKNGKYPHITTTQAYRIVKGIADKLGLEHFGNHSLRKTFGRFYYEETKDLVKLQKIFNHSSQSVTMEYIGLTQDEIDETLKKFYL